ncbi:MAG: dienelactone hydrolase family protein [Leptolyngbya sp. SIO1E4]|nr:dienelactone hydrolase family protein [Leptolyngbya sp. SIO1E4]
MKTLPKQNNDSSISITAGSVQLTGNLVIPTNAQGIVLFAHGSGSSRRSPRNRYVAEVLQEACLATFLFDLLTVEEEQIDQLTRRLRFDIGLLTDRLIRATDWIRQNPTTRQLKIGYFGASTGSAAALMAAAECPDAVSAIVSRGGRPDLAGSTLTRIKVPTLLIVGGDDTPVVALNQKAYQYIPAEKHLKIIPGATHLFEEPGTLEQVAQLASQWFRKYLT